MFKWDTVQIKLSCFYARFSNFDRLQYLCNPLGGKGHNKKNIASNENQFIESNAISFVIMLFKHICGFIDSEREKEK